MRLLLTALVLSGCAPALKCVAQEGYGELPAAKTVELDALANPSDACRAAFREAALARMKTSWPRARVVDEGGELRLSATLENAQGSLRVIDTRTGAVVRETRFTAPADAKALEVCRAFGAEIIDARRGCPVSL